MNKYVFRAEDGSVFENIFKAYMFYLHTYGDPRVTTFPEIALEVESAMVMKFDVFKRLEDGTYELIYDGHYARKHGIKTETLTEIEIKKLLSQNDWNKREIGGW